jgi:hypothetical protein
MTREQVLDGAIEYLGCADDGGLGDAWIEWYDDGHAGPGWYVSCSEYPDEGSVCVSNDAEPFPELAKLLALQDERDEPKP